MLLTSQRNRLFQILAENGLQPSIFEEDKGNTWYRIRLRANLNEVFFTVNRNTKDKEDVYEITRRPGDLESPDRTHTRFCKVWSSDYNLYDCIDDFVNWVRLVKSEVDNTDLWDENTKALLLFSSNNIITPERFSISELGATQGQLRMLIQNFDASDLPDEAKEKLVAIARTALLKAEIFNKKDWQNWIAGAFANAVSSLGLDETQIQEIVNLVRMAFGGLFLQE